MERKHKRKTASAITRILMALIVISSWAVLGVALALKSANVQMSGSISFKATEIFADITGSVSGTATTNTLGDIHIKSDTTQEQINSMATGWGNMTLDFTSDNLITVTVNITNKATDRTMWATFTDGIDGTNLNVKRYVDNTQKQTLDALEISADTTSTIKIEMSVADLNTSIENGAFGLGIDLFATKPEVKVASEYSMLTFSYNDTQKTATLTGNNNATGNIVIPSQILKNDDDSQEDAYTVTAIANSSFKDNTEITALMIPETVSSITTSQQGTPISGCSNLTTLAVSSENETYHSVSNGVYTSADNVLIMGAGNVVIPEETTKIENGAFQGDLSITSVVIPEGVTEIGYAAFRDCTNLVSVTLPESVTTIEGEAFRRCTSLESINIPSGVTSFEYCVFYGCESLKTDLYISKNVTNIDDAAFHGCGNIDSMIVEEGNAKYHSYENGIYEGTTLIATCKNTTKVEEGATIGTIFRGNKVVEFVYLPDGITLEKAAFMGCSSLKSIRLPADLQDIPDAAFNSSGLEEIKIPKGIEIINANTFTGCKLKHISFEEGMTVLPAYSEMCLFRDSKSTLKTIKFPSTLESWPSSGVGSFGGYTALESIEFPRCMTRLVDNAFSGCTSLTSITIPSSVTCIGAKAFFGCTSLTSITIPEGVTSIEESAFYGCTSLENVYISEGVMEIGANAFFGCTAITSITVPATVTSIGCWAFYCENVKSIIFQETNGWSAGSLGLSAEEVGDPSIMAEYLTSRSSLYAVTWTRSDS